MSELDRLIKQIAKNNNNDLTRTIAWFIGYTENLSSQINEVRKAVGAEPIGSIYEIYGVNNEQTRSGRNE